MGGAGGNQSPFQDSKRFKGDDGSSRSSRERGPGNPDPRDKVGPGTRGRSRSPRRPERRAPPPVRSGH